MAREARADNRRWHGGQTLAASPDPTGRRRAARELNDFIDMCLVELPDMPGAGPGRRPALNAWRTIGNSGPGQGRHMDMSGKDKRSSSTGNDELIV
jgi:hypothetical protein